MSPDQDAEQPDQQRRRDHGAVREHATAAERRQQHGRETHARQDGNVDLRMAKEPEEVEPEQRRAVAAAVEYPVHEIARRDKETRAGVAVAEEQKQRSEQNGKGEQRQQGRGEPGPYREWQPLPRHALAASVNDRHQRVDSRAGGGEREQRDAGQPEIHPGTLARAGRGHRGERWVGRPARDRRTSLGEDGGEQREQRRQRHPEGPGVQPRKRHVPSTDLRREDQVAESGLRGHCHHKEDHQRAVEREHRQVVSGKEMAKPRIRVEEVEAHGEREQRAQRDCSE